MILYAMSQDQIACQKLAPVMRSPQPIGPILLIRAGYLSRNKPPLARDYPVDVTESGQAEPMAHLSC